MDYRGRVAIVTGASSGIGRQTALDLADRGASLVLVEERWHELWVPRVYRLAWLFRIFLPGVYRAAWARFDPVPREAIEGARPVSHGD